MGLGAAICFKQTLNVKYVERSNVGFLQRESNASGNVHGCLEYTTSTTRVGLI